MSLRPLFLALTCGTVVLAATPAADAEILAEEFFSHPDGHLAGNTPTPGPGGAWVGHDDPADDPVLVSGGQAILTQLFGSGGREDVSLPIGVQDAGALLFARFDFMLPSSTNLTGDPPGLNRSSDPPTPLDEQGLYFAHFKSDETTTQFRARLGIAQPASGGDFGMAINANGQRLNEGTAWPADLSFDTTYRAVISWDGATGESKLWLDPADESSPSITDTKVPAGQQMEAFALRQSNDYDGQQIIDNLVVATTFAEALAGTGTGMVPGDYNGNGLIDAADYTVWRDHLGNTGAPGIPGDGDDGTLTGTPDGTVDANDYAYWVSRFGATSGAGSLSPSASAVPEPAGVLMSLVGIALLGAIRRPKFRLGA